MADDIGRVVQGRKRDKVLYLPYHLIIDDHRLTKHLSPVDDAVTEPEKRTGGDTGGGMAHRDLEEELETFTVVGNRSGLDDIPPSRRHR